jgi:hypothetical protein
MISLLTGTAQARGECKKWNTEISICDTSPSLCTSGGTQTSDATFGQTRYYFNYLYVDYDDRQKACDYAYRWTVYRDVLKVPIAIDDPINPTMLGCRVDVDDSGMIERDEAYNHTVLDLEFVTREPMCDLVPNGPYSQFGTTGTPGGHFSTAQRETARQQNVLELGSLRSDIGPARPPTLDPLEYNLLNFRGDYIFGYDDDIFIPLIGGVQDGVNADHIIPRKDIHGCDCGPNSMSNMILVSWKTNISMSNNSADPRRQEILARYTTIP